MTKPVLLHIHLSVPQKYVDAFVNLLEGMAENVSWDVPSEVVHIDAFVSNKEDNGLTASAVKTRFFSSLKAHNLPEPNIFVIKEIGEKNWLLENQLSFPPIDVGSFFIHGSHFTGPKPKDKICLEINAALAFGSGEHGSTKGCLSALSSLQNFSPQNGLDVGCGSGILAMAAASLFHIPVHALDIDPFSVETTKENLKKNSLEDRIICFQSNGYDGLDQNQTFDLILCNILAKPLCEMAPTLKHHLNPQGIAILSGLLNTQSEEVIEQHQECGLHLKETIHIREWATLILKNEQN